jgi:anti-sigma B factor antagonist
LRREDVGDVAVLVVEGEVDLVTAPTLETQLDSMPPGTSLVVDLCELTFMDSSGLHVLLDATNRLKGRVHIACVPSGSVGRLFELVLGTDEALKVFETRTQAVAAFSS